MSDIIKTLVGEFDIKQYDTYQFDYDQYKQILVEC